MKPQKPLVALCPIGKFVFSNEEAIRHKKLVQQKLRDLGVEFVVVGLSGCHRSAPS